MRTKADANEQGGYEGQGDIKIDQGAVRVSGMGLQDPIDRTCNCRCCCTQAKAWSAQLDMKYLA